MTLYSTFFKVVFYMNMSNMCDSEFHTKLQFMSICVTQFGQFFGLKLTAKMADLLMFFIFNRSAHFVGTVQHCHSDYSVF